MRTNHALPARRTAGLRALLWLALFLGPIVLQPLPRAEARPSADAPPTASLNAPGEAPLGQDVSFTVTFNNNDPADTGYGPHVDLYLPFSDIDGSVPAPGNDGISIVSATFGGLSVVLQTVNCNAGANFTPSSDNTDRDRPGGALIGRDDPVPIVDHACARQRALAAHREARREGASHVPHPAQVSQPALMGSPGFALPSL